MDKYALKRFAVWAREQMMAGVRTQAAAHGMIDQNMIEAAAGSWFIRLTTLRYMEIHDMLPRHRRIFTDVHHELNRQTLDAEAIYHICDALAEGLPWIFGKTAVPLELLFCVSWLDEDGVVCQLVNSIPEADWLESVQIVGWLFQYYQSEKKEAIFAALKQNVKVGRDQIPAATQLFTPEWIVRYMVEGSLGRLWLEGHPASTACADWSYNLKESAQAPEVRAQMAASFGYYAGLRPEDLRCMEIHLPYLIRINVA